MALNRVKVQHVFLYIVMVLDVMSYHGQRQ